MGNEASVINESGKPLIMHIFNNSEMLYKIYKDEYHLPSEGGQAVVIRGTAGGGAVKAGILYPIKREGSFVYDIFSVRDNGKLILKKVTDVDGVIDFAGDAVLVEKGLAVTPLNASNLLKSVLGQARTPKD